MKTYGTYQSNSGAREIDQFHVHELLDRLHVIRVMFNDFVSDHPAAVLVAEDVEHVCRKLSSLYQKVGRIEFGE